MCTMTNTFMIQYNGIQPVHHESDHINIDIQNNHSDINNLNRIK